MLILGGACLLVLLLPSPAPRAAGTGDFLQVTVTLRVLLLAGGLLVTWRVLLVSVGIYTPGRLRSVSDYCLRCLIGLNCCVLVEALLHVLLRMPGEVWRRTGAFWAVSLLLMAFGRVVLLLWSAWVTPRLRKARTLVIVGSGPRARDALRELEENAEWSYRLIGFVDSEPQAGFVSTAQILGGIDELEQVLIARRVEEVIIALPMKSQYEAVGYAIAVCQMLQIPSQYVTDHFPSAVSQRREGRSPLHGRPRKARGSRGSQGWWKRFGTELVDRVLGRSGV